MRIRVGVLNVSVSLWYDPSSVVHAFEPRISEGSCRAGAPSVGSQGVKGRGARLGSVVSSQFVCCGEEILEANEQATLHSYPNLILLNRLGNRS